MRRKLWASAIVAGAMALGAASAAYANTPDLLTNGGFDTGFLNPWTLSGTGYANVLTNAAYAQAGHSFGVAVGGQVTLSQSFTDIAGLNYQATGYLRNYTSGDPSNFDMWTNNSNPHQVIVNPVTATNGWVQYTFNFVGTGHDTLNISSENFGGTNYIDSFSVHLVPGPIPGTGLLSFVVLALAGAATRMRGYLSV